MKKIHLIFSTVAATAVVVLLAAGCASKDSQTNEEPQEVKAVAGSIVYFNMDRVLAEYDMASDLSSVMETKANSINEELNRRGTKLESDIKAFQDKINKGLMTQSVADVQSQRLQQQQYDFQNYTAQKQAEIAEEQQVMMNQIADAIKSFLDSFNAEKGYAMILATQGDILPLPVACGNTDLDITDDILEGLNAAYVKEKGKKSE